MLGNNPAETKDNAGESERDRQRREYQEVIKKVQEVGRKRRAGCSSANQSGHGKKLSQLQ